MLEPITKGQETRIVNNVVAACKDINKLNPIGYKYLYLASGFIAHYNIHGFKHHYGVIHDLRSDILEFARFNKWENFRPGDKNYAYYKSKALVYKAIVEKLTGSL